MTNVPRNVLKPPPQNRGGGSNKLLMLVTPDPFPSPPIKKKAKGLARQTNTNPPLALFVRPPFFPPPFL